ncbi:hypothetical protein ACTACG_21875 [Pseudomonas syringae]|uniref:hypothetical protein n=1 Tax=Pseudomonas syringae TaxID=317 RepID=UPI003F74B390
MGATFYRSTVRSGPMVAGYYKFKDYFQILPSQKIGEPMKSYFDIEFTDAHMIRAGNPELSRLSEENYNRRAHLDYLKELVALIYISTNFFCDLDYDRDTQILPPPQPKIESFTDLSGLYPIRKCVGRVAAKQNSNVDFLMIDNDADVFFGNYFKLSEFARKRCRASLFLYQSMRKVMRESTSMAIVGLISSIENLVDYESFRNKESFESCPVCDIKKYALTRRFKEFMLAYSEFSNGNTKKVLDGYYSQRSKIAHTGALLEMDILLSEFSMRQHLEIYVEIERHVRIAIYNYLVNYDFSRD